MDIVGLSGRGIPTYDNQKERDRVLWYKQARLQQIGDICHKNHISK